MTKPYRVAVLVSGNGSNLQALIDSFSCDDSIEIKGVISNKACAYALVRATNANIATAVFDKDQQGNQLTKPAFEALTLNKLSEWQTDLVVLAGFMKVLSKDFISTLATPIINLHPSLLPAYKGLYTHERVLQAGERYHGCSVHWVNEVLDGGQVISQAITTTHPHDTPECLANRIHALEHQLLPWTVSLLAKGVFDKSPLPLPWRLWL